MTSWLVFSVVAALLALWWLIERGKRRTRAMPPGLHPDIVLPHTAQWTLYHNAFSLCSKKVRVCLAEYGVSYDSVPIDLIETGKYQNISRGFLLVNPGATVPVLVHNGQPIYESHEQLRYVASAIDSGNLLVPKDIALRQLMDEWVKKTSLIGDDPIESPESTLGNAIPGLTIPIFASMVAKISLLKIFEGVLFHRIKRRALFFGLMKLAGLPKTLTLKPVNKFVNWSVVAMHVHLDDLEAQLLGSGGPWICGEQFTLADIGMMVIFDRLREGDWLDLLVNQRTMLGAYWAALQQRQSYRDGCLGFEHPAVTQATAQLMQLKQLGKWPSDLPQ